MNNTLGLIFETPTIPITQAGTGIELSFILDRKQLLAGILDDKTMDDKFKYFPNDDKQNNP